MSLGRFHRLAALAAATLLLARPVPSLAESSFGDWAAIFVAGDFHAHNGAPTEVFDNARRDAAAAFTQAGFAAENIRQLSVRPDRYPAQMPQRADFKNLRDGLAAVAAKAKGGCLVYLTSHGSPSGMLLNQGVLSPRALARMVGDSCGSRPTVVVVSACFSGVFVPALAGANRLVMTAARPDRSSFGCTEDDKYPYFDACLLQVLPKARHFGELPALARECVAAREKAEKLEPASEPQTRVGGMIAPVLPLYPFERPSG